MVATALACLSVSTSAIVVGSLGALLAVVPILASPIRSLGRMSELENPPLAEAIA